MLFEAPLIISNNVRIDCEYIGAYTFINEYVTIRHTKRIGRFCSIAPNVYIGLVDHPIEAMSSSDFFYGKNRWELSSNDYNYKGSSFKLHKEKITIGNDVWIGMGAMIMRGVHIADGSVFAAGAVVTHDTKLYEIVGVPAKHIKMRVDEETQKAFLNAKWWEYEVSTWNKVNISKASTELMRLINSNSKKMNPIFYKFYPLEKMIKKYESNVENIIFDQKENKVEKGGISVNGCIYNREKKWLEVRGWFLPSFSYDTVEISSSIRVIGNAKQHCLRLDVLENHPEYMDARSGFELKMNIEMSVEEDVIYVRCRKNGEVIYTTQKLLTVFQ